MTFSLQHTGWKIIMWFSWLVKFAALDENIAVGQLNESSCCKLIPQVDSMLQCNVLITYKRLNYSCLCMSNLGRRLFYLTWKKMTSLLNYTLFVLRKVWTALKKRETNLILSLTGNNSECVQSSPYASSPNLSSRWTCHQRSWANDPGEHF